MPGRVAFEAGTFSDLEAVWAGFGCQTSPFSRLGTDSSHGFSSFVEDEAVEVVGQVG